MTQTGKRTATIIEDSVAHSDPRAASGTPVFEGTDVPIQSLFDCLDSGYNLYFFLDQFPSVSPDRALEAIKQRLDASSVIHSDRRIVSGTPVFKGTRVMVKNLFDYLEGGHDLDDFLDDFPTVTREQASVALDAARKTMERDAYEVAAR